MILIQKNATYFIPYQTLPDPPIPCHTTRNWIIPGFTGIPYHVLPPTIWYHSLTLHLYPPNQTMLYHAIPYHNTPCYAMPYHTIPCHDMTSHAIKHHIPYYTVPYHTILYLTLPYRKIPYHIMLYLRIPHRTHHLHYTIFSLPYPTHHTTPYHTIS